jgi:hypothetical protein
MFEVIVRHEATRAAGKRRGAGKVRSWIWWVISMASSLRGLAVDVEKPENLN